MKHLLALAALVLLSCNAVADTVSSEITGTVYDAEGNPLAGTVITIRHQPTSQTRHATSNASGHYSARGLRVGGPYTVTIASPGLSPVSYRDIHLSLDAGRVLDARLVSAARDLEEITVTGTALRGTVGPGSAFGARDIQNAVSISRDLADLARFDPRVVQNGDQLSFAGQNNRFNSFTVDGSAQNDVFGLNSSGYPTRRNPISVEAVAALDVLIAPFDVRYNGFAGGNINAVTKSGTNEFSGNVYYYFTDDRFVNDPPSGTAAAFEDKTYGFTLGGPIIRDKLFFFANHEDFESLEPYDGNTPAGSGRVNEIAAITADDIARVTDIMNRIYGFDPGIVGSSLPETDRKLLAKLDWNINDYHRASLRYQFNEGNDVFPENTVGTSIGLTSNWYDKAEQLTNYNVQLFSDWSSHIDGLTTRFIWSRNEIVTNQDPLNGDEFAEFEISTIGGGTIFVGGDEYRQANFLTNDTTRTNLDIEYGFRDHLITAGYNRERTEIFNQFVPQSDGVYQFDSIDALEARTASAFRYRNAVTGNPVDGSASFAYAINSLYLQDTWTPLPGLELMFGLRHEFISSDDHPARNDNFVARNGYGNDRFLDGLDLLQPRASFRWDATHNLTLRGGLGLFSGGRPTVWLSNTFSNDGVSISTPDLQGLDPALYLTGIDGYTVPSEIDAVVLPGNGEVNLITRDFQLPSQWKYNLGLDADLPWGIRAAVDVDGSRVRHEVAWTALGAEPSGATAPDGRPIYTTKDFSAFQDIAFGNTDQGDSLLFTLGLRKSFDFGLDLTAGFTAQDANAVYAGNRSLAVFGWSANPSTDQADPGLATSLFETRRRFTLGLGYVREFIAGYETRINLFHEIRSGGPYSYVYDTDPTDPFVDPRIIPQQLVYVPTDNDPLVVLDGIGQAELQDWLRDTGLGAYRGRIAPRNAFRTQGFSHWDMRITQQLPGFRRKDRIVIVIDIENLGNLLNDEWGDLRHFRFLDTQIANTEVADIDINDRGQYILSNLRTVRPNLDLGQSLYRIQFGIRYEL